jgi:hypothetical protein
VGVDETLARSVSGWEHLSMRQRDFLPQNEPGPLPRFGPSTRANPFWRAVMIAGGLFCLSCFLWITAGYGDQAAPGNVWLNRNGLLLVGITGGASVVSSVSAMVVDSLQTRRLGQTDRAVEEARSPESHA